VLELRGRGGPERRRRPRPDGTGTRRYTVGTPSRQVGECNGHERSPRELRSCRSERQPGQAEIAAEGGAGRRSAARRGRATSPTGGSCRNATTPPGHGRVRRSTASSRGRKRRRQALRSHRRGPTQDADPRRGAAAKRATDATGRPTALCPGTPHGATPPGRARCVEAPVVRPAAVNPGLSRGSRPAGGPGRPG
jgi:hypothetical protein